MEFCTMCRKEIEQGYLQSLSRSLLQSMWDCYLYHFYTFIATSMSVTSDKFMILFETSPVINKFSKFLN